MFGGTILKKAAAKEREVFENYDGGAAVMDD